MKVFISYADQDKEVAQDLASRLSEAGLQVWYDADQLHPGDNWGLQIGKALEDSDAMVVLISPAAMGSRRVREEIDFALTARSYCDRLIPVQVKTVAPESVPWILLKLGLIRYGQNNRAEAVRKIVERLEAAPV